jgi:hypothetical protein
VAAKPKRHRTPSNEIEDVFLTRKTCGHCGAVDPMVYDKSDDESDGIKMQLARCRVCKKVSRLIWEIPELPRN